MGPSKKESVRNRHLYSRVSFLQQAAGFLAVAHGQRRKEAPPTPPPTTSSASPSTLPGKSANLQGMARRLATDMRSVARKTLIRLTPTMKETVCRYCDSVLIEGRSCMTTVENRSRGGRKPWADVLVYKCTTCGREKRYPIGADRQQRRPKRGLASQETTAAAASHTSTDPASAAVAPPSQEQEISDVT